MGNAGFARRSQRGSTYGEPFRIANGSRRIPLDEAPRPAPSQPPLPAWRALRAGGKGLRQELAHPRGPCRLRQDLARRRLGKACEAVRGRYADERLVGQARCRRQRLRAVLQPAPCRFGGFRPGRAAAVLRGAGGRRAGCGSGRPGSRHRTCRPAGGLRQERARTRQLRGCEQRPGRPPRQLSYRLHAGRVQARRVQPGSAFSLRSEPGPGFRRHGRARHRGEARVGRGGSHGVPPFLSRGGRRGAREHPRLGGPGGRRSASGLERGGALPCRGAAPHGRGSRFCCMRPALAAGRALGGALRTGAGPSGENVLPRLSEPAALRRCP